MLQLCARVQSSTCKIYKQGNIRSLIAVKQPTSTKSVYCSQARIVASKPQGARGCRLAMLISNNAVTAKDKTGTSENSNPTTTSALHFQHSQQAETGTPVLACTVSCMPALRSVQRGACSRKAAHNAHSTAAQALGTGLQIQFLLLGGFQPPAPANVTAEIGNVEFRGLKVACLLVIQRETTSTLA